MNTAKIPLLASFLAALVWAAVPSSSFGQGTAFNYQGRLNYSNAPATGVFDMRFTVYDSPGGANVIAGPITNSTVVVTNGLFFTVLDFGGPLMGTNWMEIAVRTNGAIPYTVLSPRQLIMPVPFSIFANTASNLTGTISPNQLNGPISPDQLPPGVTTNGGSFSGNGSGLTNLSASGLPTNVAYLNLNQTFTGRQLITNGSSGGLFQIANPQGRFQFDGWAPSLNTTLLGAFVGAGASYPQLRFASDGSAHFMDIGQNTSGDFVVEGDDNARLVVRNAGGVGIGTPNPHQAVEIVGGSGTSVRLTGPGGAGVRLGLDLAPFDPVSLGLTNASARIQAVDKNYSADIDIQTRNPGSPNDTMNSRLFIDSASGNVGIGTNVPLAKLHAAGDIFAEGKVYVGNMTSLAAIGQENLRVVRGTIYDDGITWHIQTGSGFSISHPSAGAYSITFSPAFSSPPTVTVSAFSSIAFANNTGATASSVSVQLINLVGSGKNDHWGFIAIGPR